MRRLILSLLFAVALPVAVLAQQDVEEMLKQVPAADMLPPQEEIKDPYLAVPEDQAPPDQAPPEVRPLMLRTVILRGLNKVTAKTSDIEARVGILARFGNLEIVARDCWKAPPTQRPENAALLDIWERKQDSKPMRVFLGWMFGSSPSLSAMEHPVYDITVLECQEEPVVEGEDLEKALEKGTEDEEAPARKEEKVPDDTEER